MNVATKSERPRWAVITGAAGGIGRALVRAFADHGFRVIATDQVPPPDGLACTHYLRADLAQTVTNEANAHEVFSQIGHWVGNDGLHALVNNAAVQILGGVDSLTREDWQSTLNVNLVAPFVWVQALLPHLEAANGSVVNISSIHAKLTKKNFVAYATSKAALSGMTRAMAVDLGPRIRVNAIEPAAISTDMLMAGFAAAPDQYDKLEAYHPQGRIGTPTEVAQLAVLLAADALKFMHGAIVSMDGGMSGCLHDPG